MKLIDLKFPVKVWDFTTGKVKEVNLFSSQKVLSSIAVWRTMTDEERESVTTDQTAFCFGDTWGRVEWEFSVDKDGNIDAPFQDWSKNDLSGYKKTDVFSYYVLPNEKKLMKMVRSASRRSCELFLKKERGYFNGERK